MVALAKTQTASRPRWRFILSAVAATIAGLAALTPSQALAEVTPLAHVEMRGTGGTSLLLVPGLGVDWSIWSAFMDRNTEQYTMYAVTIPGFGESEPPAAADDEAAGAGQPWIDNAVAALSELIEERKIAAPIVVGQGALGGFIALRLSVEHADQVSKLLIVDGLMPALPLAGSLPPLADRLELTQRMKPLLETMSDEQWERFRGQSQDASRMVADPGRAKQISQMLQSTPRPTTLGYLIEMMRTDLTPTLGDLKAPALLLYAWPGSMTEQEKQGKLLSMSAMGQGTSAQVVTVPGSRRFMMYDRPDAFDKAVRLFAAGEKLDSTL